MRPCSYHLGHILSTRRTCFHHGNAFWPCGQVLNTRACSHCKKVHHPTSVSSDYEWVFSPWMVVLTMGGCSHHEWMFSHCECRLSRWLYVLTMSIRSHHDWTFSLWVDVRTMVQRYITPQTCVLIMSESFPHVIDIVLFPYYLSFVQFLFTNFSCCYPAAVLTTSVCSHR